MFGRYNVEVVEHRREGAIILTLELKAIIKELKSKRCDTRIVDKNDK